MLKNRDEKMFAHYFFPFGEFPGDLVATKTQTLVGWVRVAGWFRRQRKSVNRSD
jgi:hypothetical protein